jgi:hypothetical protein
MTFVGVTVLLAVLLVIVVITQSAWSVLARVAGRRHGQHLEGASARR